MKIDILSIFPEMFEGPLTCSLLAKARNKKILDICCTDIRSFTKDKHNKVDDRPFGGGPGMIMKPEPVYEALKSVGVKKRNNLYKNPLKKPLVIYMSPQGETLNTNIIKELAQYEHLVLLCGHYEGIDERIIQWVDREISIGDYVLTGGEIPAMVLIDSVARMLPEVVQDKLSVEQDSFYNGLLDYPHYTRPAEFKKLSCSESFIIGQSFRNRKMAKRTGFGKNKKKKT
ncbi:tRNA (guanosine(37)-N1)-methyltransferase TrmD [Elusimicrobiota bacterium]